ncbi:MAG: hypothetical protein HY549_11205 [Elusimicrobia bacterium]|nr:hypothetical protein [Elusimicrobiota bacterium]
MKNLLIKIEISVTSAAFQWGLAGLLLSFSAVELGSENVTLTTYYPAPSGVYTKMITTGQTILARDGGNVGIGTGPTAPAVTLDVNGTIRGTLVQNPTYAP